MIEHILRRHPKVIATGVFAVPDPRSGDQVMAAIEVADLADFDPVEFADYLAAQADLGTKAAPRFVRVSTDLPSRAPTRYSNVNFKPIAGGPTNQCSTGWAEALPNTR